MIFVFRKTDRSPDIPFVSFFLIWYVTVCFSHSLVITKITFDGFFSPSCLHSQRSDLHVEQAHAPMLFFSPLFPHSLKAPSRTNNISMYRALSTFVLIASNFSIILQFIYLSFPNLYKKRKDSRLLRISLHYFRSNAYAQLHNCSSCMPLRILWMVCAAYACRDITFEVYGFF